MGDNISKVWWIVGTIIIILIVLIPLWKTIIGDFKIQADVYKEKNIRYEQTIGN